MAITIDNIIHLLFAVFAIYTQQDEGYFHVAPWLRGFVFYSLATVSILLSLRAIIFVDFTKGLGARQASGKTIAHSKAKSKAMEVNIKGDTCGVQILQARYGTSSKDVDVTTVVQNMVVDNVLKIPKSLSLNSIFGDPHSFRRKKLRLIGHVNGKPFVESLSEIRWKDYVLDGRIKNVVDSSQSDGQEDAEIIMSASGKSKYSRIVNILVDDFRGLAGKNLESFGDVATESFLVPCLHIADLIDSFGSSFLPVKANITDNVAKIRKKITELKMKNADSEPTTLGQWIRLEARQKTARIDGSICVSTLWLKRALNFMVEFFVLLSNGMDTFDASQQAFKKKLAPWQGWLVQTTCKTALRMVPSRGSFIQIFVPQIERQSIYQGGSNGGLQDRQKSVLMDVMHVILNSGLKQIIGQMDLWFTRENLDYPDKC